jgi:hypothetical protein
MTGPEHYKEAERLLESSREAIGGLLYPLEGAYNEALRAAAQVHATLAMTAALRSYPAQDSEADRQAWDEAAGR